MPDAIGHRRRTRERKHRRRNRRLAGLRPGEKREEVLVAEGDSWFSFPGSNVLRELRYLGYSITSVAEPGDTMAYMAGNVKELTSAYRRAIRDHGAVHGVLLSGGGNEIMAEGLGDMLLCNGSESTLDDEKVDKMIDGIEKSYDKMIVHIEDLAGDSPPAIFVHGYEHPIPDGRGIEDASLLLALLDALPMIELPGPWMAPQFRCKGYDWPGDRVAMMEAMAYLVDRLNGMLESLAAAHPRVHHVDLRQVFPPERNHKRYWHDEIHPTHRGFRMVMVEFDEQIQHAIGEH